MLTSKQIKELPKGDYPNWKLREMFPKQQGDGYSAKMTIFKEDKEGQQPSFITKLINQFTGKEVKKKAVQRTTNK